MRKKSKRGDFTGLAEQYSAYRPGYSASVLSAIVGLANKPVTRLDVADIGAGTGIWTRMLAARHVRSLVAVEPNHDMRARGIRDSAGLRIRWCAGSAESTGLRNHCCDLVTMASSFHWVKFDKGVQEFTRILRPGGWFVALWNPRYIESNPLLVRIERHLYKLKPKMVRVSSGRSGITNTLTDRLWHCKAFDDVVYFEGRHVRILTPSQYIGVWRSVNDVQVQLGPEKFSAFIDFIRTETAGLRKIETVYLTRAWAARVR